MRNAYPILILASLVSTLHAGDWPGWRGPHQNGSSDEKALPSKFSRTEKVKWSAPMPGPAASTPAVVKGKVFVSSTDPESKKLLGICYDAATGKELWRKELGEGLSSDERSNFANPSPTADAEKVIFHFATGDTAALTHEGKEIWKKNLEKEYGKFAIQWTPASSPVLHKGQLFFQVLQRDTAFEFGGVAKGNPDGKNDSYVLSLDAATGAEKWKVVRPAPAQAESLESFSTPMVYTHEGREELLITGGDCITGHDTASGKELWRWQTWNPTRISHWRLVPGPVAGAGVVLACAPKREPVYAFKLGGNGMLGEKDIAWISGDDVNSKDVSSDVSTPLFHDGVFYVVNSDRKSIHAVEPSGKQLWERRLEGGQKLECSPTAGAGRMHLIDHRGKVTLLNLADGEIVHETDMGENNEKDIRSSIALADGRLFIRTNKTLFCIE